MEHEALVEVIDRLILSGLDETGALLLVARFLDEEAEDFFRTRDDMSC